METTTVTEITADRFAAAVLDASRERPVVVDFWAPWCGPCHQLSPLLEQVASRHTGDVDTVKLNVDTAPQIAQQFGIRGIPAVKAFRDGKVVAEFTGVQPEPAIEQFYGALAPSQADRLVAHAEGAPSDADRETLLRQALDADPGHAGAVVALARLLIDRGDAAEARALLERVEGHAAARRLIAELDLGVAGEDADLDELAQAADAGDADAALALGRALAARGEHAAALERLLAAVRHPVHREDARTAILQIFDLLGDDHEFVRSFRPKLAAALF